ncbi:hypothetical protein Ddye_025845 [Dipteronia dyeriana]|uniref:RNase H type-1 domain-containing protein n=1 Tax=Dipteronia dyeriana TaxID=168575 RepID=A0AAD9TM43_9ROSI|nr:hypothetical protein Ddye_025845 [Dipteronia dyeriana]
MVFWVVWFFQNQATLEGGKIVFVDALSLLWRFVREVDSLQSGTMKNSMDELQTLQRLYVSGRPPKASRILEVNWRPPPPGCLKVNTDGVAFGSPGLTGCAGFFRTCRDFVKDCFAFEAELAAAVYTIDYTWTFGWRWLWLESDSTFVVDILRSRSRKVPWRWRPAWDRCLGLISKMDFVVTHIYREDLSSVEAEEDSIELKDRCVCFLDKSLEFISLNPNLGDPG